MGKQRVVLAEHFAVPAMEASSVRWDLQRNTQDPPQAEPPVAVAAPTVPSKLDRLRLFFFPPENLPSWDPPPVPAEPSFPFKVGEWVKHPDFDGVGQVMDAGAASCLVAYSDRGERAVRVWVADLLPARRP